MNLLRRLPTSRLIALCASVVVLAGGATTAAVAALGGGASKPAPKRLAVAIHDALGAPQVQGVFAHIRFTNRLIDDSSVEGGSPLLKGATGRLWATKDRLRLELQSSSGDVQIVVGKGAFWVYDASSSTVYRGTLPPGADKGKEAKAGKHAKRQLPTVAQIAKWLGQATRHASVSGAIPSTVADEPAYTVRVGPKHDGGLLGAAKLAWDAVHGVPLRAAIYAQGSGSPVLELTATDIAYGPRPASDFDISPPADAKVVKVRQAPGAGAEHRARSAKSRAHRARRVQGLAAVQSAVPFKLSAPAKLVGMPRHDVKLLDWGGKPAALVLYGQNLGGIAVIERQPDPAKAKTGAQPKQKTKQGRRNGRTDVNLPTISVNGATGTELATALGTVVTFERGGVSYTVIGSVPPAAAETAARGL